MIGSILNVAGILAGGAVGLLRAQPLSPAKEAFFKVTLGALTVFFGLRLTWLSLNGSLPQILKQLLVAVMALTIGRLTGRLVGLQEMSNRLGQSARKRLTAATPGDPRRVNEGFKTCAALFCAAPLGPLGAVQDGLSNYFYPLAVKAVVDGLATMSLVSLFSWGAMLAALPVLAIQGTITLVCSQLLEPFLRTHGLIESVNATGGLLVFSVALVILDLKKIGLADYLPSLVVAPLIAWLWR